MDTFTFPRWRQLSFPLKVIQPGRSKYELKLCLTSAGYLFKVVIWDEPFNDLTKVLCWEECPETYWNFKQHWSANY